MVLIELVLKWNLEIKLKGIIYTITIHKKTTINNQIIVILIYFHYVVNVLK